MRLLWVENHAVFAELARRQFLAAHEVVIVPSVAEARTALACAAYDAVLVDYDLDDGKGTALVEVVRQLPHRPALIATSSHDDGNRLLLAAGADAICSKMRFAEIETVLAAALAAKAARG